MFIALDNSTAHFRRRPPHQHQSPLARQLSVRAFARHRGQFIVRQDDTESERDMEDAEGSGEQKDPPPSTALPPPLSPPRSLAFAQLDLNPGTPGVFFAAPGLGPPEV